VSIKLYNGYRALFPDGFNLFEWQEKLALLRDQLSVDAKKLLLQNHAQRAVYALDRDTMGLARSYPEHSPLMAAYKAVKEDCEALGNGMRRPTFDTGAAISWLLLDASTVLVLLFVEKEKYERLIITVLGLEDYHYQNQTDPEGCTAEEMDARGAVWKEAFGGWQNAPSARFHSFTACEAPKRPPFMHPLPEEPPFHKDIPLEKRAHDIAFDLLFAESKDEAAGVDPFTKLMSIEREVAEGGTLHARLLELTEEVQGKLLAEPTWEDYRREPSTGEDRA